MLFDPSKKGFEVPLAPPPEEFETMQETAKRTGANKLTMRDINAEIADRREARRNEKRDPRSS